MTPYELRFEIFKQAQYLADQEFHVAFTVADQWNQINSVKMDYPDFPSYEEIEALANRINNFVSSK